MQRSRSGDRQPPPRGGGPDLGKEIMKAEHYPTMGKVMELMREDLRKSIRPPVLVESEGLKRVKSDRSVYVDPTDRKFRKSTGDLAPGYADLA